MKTCPIPLCGGSVKLGHLMCRGCWSRVPRALRTAVSRSYAAYKKAGVEDAFSTLKVYRAARDAAIAAVEASRP